MAFPWVFNANFEAGTLGEFDAETDVGARLDAAHYSSLAERPGASAPWQGAYCMRVDLGIATNDAYVQENDGFDIAADGTLHIRFQLYLSPDTVMANTNEFEILQLQSTGPVDEVVVVVNYTTAAGFRLGIGETAGTSFLPLSLGVWHTVELSISLDDGAGNDGTIDAWLDGSPFVQVASLDQAAIIQARIGVIGQDAGTTRGLVLFDNIMVDDARMGNMHTGDRWPTDVQLFKSGHVFVGHGCVENVSLIAGAGTDCVLAMYDTDVASTNIGQRRGLMQNTANNETVDTADMPKKFQRGCYITLSGTNPQAIVKIGHANGYWSDGRVRQVGMDRKQAPGGL
jgi:hypothetical protein